MDNGVFHHRRSIGPSAASAKTCSTGCSMVQSSLAPFKKMRALYTVHIGFNLHNMDKMSISNHVSTVDRSARNSTAPVPSFCVQHRSIRNRLSLTRCFTCVASKLSKQEKQTLLPRVGRKRLHTLGPYVICLETSYRGKLPKEYGKLKEVGFHKHMS